MDWKYADHNRTSRTEQTLIYVIKDISISTNQFSMNLPIVSILFVAPITTMLPRSSTPSNNASSVDTILLWICDTSVNNSYKEIETSTIKLVYCETINNINSQHNTIKKFTHHNVIENDTIDAAGILACYSNNNNSNSNNNNIIIITICKQQYLCLI